jgi:hypothetical protein
MLRAPVPLKLGETAGTSKAQGSRTMASPSITKSNIFHFLVSVLDNKETSCQHSSVLRAGQRRSVLDSLRSVTIQCFLQGGADVPLLIAQQRRTAECACGA